MIATGASASLHGVLTPTLELETGKTWLGTDDRVQIRYTLENNSAENLFVLAWQTPVDGITHDMFLIERDGVEVAYTGMLVKRAEPRPEDYIEIAAGESLTAVFDPTSAYDMAMTGEYTITYRTAFTDVLTGSVSKSMVASRSETESNTVAFHLEGLFDQATMKANCSKNPCHWQCPNPPPTCDDGGGGGGGTGSGSLTFVACDSTQQNKITSAVANATSISRASADDLADGSSSLYETWFGTYDSGRYNTVTSNFEAIANAFETKNVTINCSDADLGYYAYVYPSNPYEIYVCYYFFRAPATGRDSKAGTLVHEMSHFNVVAGTDDIVYGESGALRLARTNPRKAIKNADNHEYFAEDH